MCIHFQQRIINYSLRQLSNCRKPKDLCLGMIMKLIYHESIHSLKHVHIYVYIYMLYSNLESALS